MAKFLLSLLENLPIARYFLRCRSQSEEFYFIFLFLLINAKVVIKGGT